MKHGFLKVAAASPKVTVADCGANCVEILQTMQQLAEERVKLAVFPELCLTGYTCNDLFLQGRMLTEAREQLARIQQETAHLDLIAAIGLPLEHAGKLYNTAAIMNRGRLLALIPKHYIPNYNEFYERRYFEPGRAEVEWIEMNGEQVPFGMNILVDVPEMPHLVIGTELCEDLWVPCPPSIGHAQAGASIILNLSASNEMVGKESYRRQLVTGQSARLVSAYIYASAGYGESTQDLVFGGHDMIAENGTLLKESPRYGNSSIITEIDLDRIAFERRRMSSYPAGDRSAYVTVHGSLQAEDTKLTRQFEAHPFVPQDLHQREERCQDILTMQAMGLAKRLDHIHASSVVIGISGGLDSTLALLVTARAFDLLKLSRQGIQAVTMPCFGTTDRTYQNACLLTEQIGASLIEIPICDAVNLHFQDISQDTSVHDVTYENSQARERTQVLMDLANQKNGIVIGTGDLSELALGWATYNGDHMSMYAVNVSIPKTLVRYLVRFYADTCGDRALETVLNDILDTPVSPELIPPEEGEISQKTEDLVGPYELHDFFLYYMLRAGYEPDKIYRIACDSFAGVYKRETIHHWLRVFYRRFFSQQFKRSCLPDGPKVGSVALSPRGDLRMPSDASSEIWMRKLNGMNGVYETKEILSPESQD
jgi:NAD+ synthase (glutamine-hydrolysing)